LGDEGQREQYDQVAGLQSHAVIAANSGLIDETKSQRHVWPTDVITIERNLPDSNRGFDPWHTIEVDGRLDDYYLAGEVCDTLGYHWFYVDGDAPRSRGELLGMRLIARERGVNLLLNVPPDRHGLISAGNIEALLRLREDFEALSR
jgi:alpha-L-fucosidase